MFLFDFILDAWRDWFILLPYILIATVIFTIVKIAWNVLTKKSWDN